MLDQPSGLVVKDARGYWLGLECILPFRIEKKKRLVKISVGKVASLVYERKIASPTHKIKYNYMHYILVVLKLNFIFFFISVGACVDGVDSYTCQCQNGYTGYDCDVDIDDCQSFPCVHGELLL